MTPMTYSAPIVRHDDFDEVDRHFLLPKFHVLIGWFSGDLGEDRMRHDGKDVISRDGFSHLDVRGGVVFAGARIG